MMITSPNSPDIVTLGEKSIQNFLKKASLLVKLGKRIRIWLAVKNPLFFD